MSDNFHVRFFSGDSGKSPQGRHVLGHFPGKRPLVEECEVVTITAIRQCFGKKALIDLIRRAKPLELPLPGGPEQVFLTWDAHHLPGPIRRKSMLEDRTSRLWLVCPCCRRRVRKLFYRLFDAARGNRSELLCRLCIGLTYQSVNCGGNKWYRAVARPLKRLLQQKEKLLSLNPSPRRNRLLQAIETNLDYVRSRSGLRNRRRKWKRCSSSDRRPYRDVGLIERYFS